MHWNGVIVGLRGWFNSLGLATRSKAAVKSLPSDLSYTWTRQITAGNKRERSTASICASETRSGGCAKAFIHRKYFVWDLYKMCIGCFDSQEDPRRRQEEQG